MTYMYLYLPALILNVCQCFLLVILITRHFFSIEYIRCILLCTLITGTIISVNNLELTNTYLSRSIKTELIPKPGPKTFVRSQKALENLTEWRRIDTNKLQDHLPWAKQYSSTSVGSLAAVEKLCHHCTFK